MGFLELVLVVFLGLLTVGLWMSPARNWWRLALIATISFGIAMVATPDGLLSTLLVGIPLTALGCLIARLLQLHQPIVPDGGGGGDKPC